ncbi:unnamed protein product [Mytilus coruscus]|uniref:C1q domain-containing protein n=1 Tax=Mytilus coruscus TaxID=42192 RepID=A0A6J8CPE2_MYTCO|nr:unnamed protein product [Mytilus coruscus]
MILIGCFISFVCFANGFLLEGKTLQPPTTSSLITDVHFDVLMKLLLEQRDSQRKQNQIITQLQSELLTTQQEVTNKYLDLNKCTFNGTLEKQYNHLLNKTDTLQNRFNILEQHYTALQTEYLQQQKTHSVDIMYIHQNLSKLDVITKDLGNELLSLKHLKTVSDLQRVNDILNDTKHLEDEIQKTNGKVNNLENDLEARKNDVLALFNKADLTERKLDKKLNELDNRVILVAGATRGNYTNGQNIIFSDIIIASGVGNAISFKSSGIFTCERSGIYQIAAYVSSNANHCAFSVRKNKTFIGDAFGSVGDSFHDFETMTFVSVVQLNVNDTLEIYSDSTDDQLIYGNRESGMSIVQIR